ncbi:hypothetical protein PN36_06795 [Candidatus Thiomargarita nelsonii]|uniref:Uncharacterized protein n=1 Tax=Candidatus Thiomargarita nelsonii TaxID=1003181 RepID=A0A0A6P6B8_9GAMM|nr:hypothetical protein PN36_06795 [Candidatus Thiomargarita nelsonii]
MKKCPVCQVPVEENTTICSRCKWEKLGIRLTATAEDQDKLEKARFAWRAKQAAEDVRLDENLPYYDFILIGHSSVGKTTYLAMLCEQGGDNNKVWNFKSGGSANYLGNNAPQDIRDRVQKGDQHITESIRKVSVGTTDYINLIREEIQRQEGYYSTLKDNKLIFSFRPTRARRQHTLLTLDYPGDWISLVNREEDAFTYQKSIKQFADYLNRSQSLILMIDPLIFMEGDSKEKNFHSQGLSEVQEQLKEDATHKRPSEFIPVSQIPVALIINKCDLLKVACEQGKPMAFLKDHCRSIYNDLNNFTTNWKLFFVSCYGNQKLKELNKQGAYAPPKDPEPVNLEKPLDWLYKQTQRRTLKEASLKVSKVTARFVLLPLAIISVIYYGAYYSVYAWDSSAFASIEEKEPVFLEQPHVLYRNYTKYDSSHWLSPWTGFKEKVHEKRKKFVRLYLDNQLAGPLKHGASIKDFKATRAQVRKWSLDLEDKAFAEKMESIISSELMPLYEEQYFKFLHEKFLRGDIEEGFTEFVKLFPNSQHIPEFEKIILEIWPLEQYKKIYQMAVNSQAQNPDINKLLQLCREYINTAKEHSHRYDKSVKALISFIENDLATLENGALSPRSFRINYRGYTLSDGMYGHHTEEYQEQYENCYTDTSGWTDTVRCNTDYRTAQREVRTPEQVVISILINGVEKYSLETTHRKRDNFSIDWMPGMTVQVVVNNKTGKTTKIEDSRFLAINLLKGNLDVNGLADVNLTGSNLSFPKLQTPSEELDVQISSNSGVTTPVVQNQPPSTVTRPVSEPARQNPIHFIRAYYEDINRGNADSAIRKWKAPKEDRLRTLINDSQWSSINEIQLVNQNDDSAEVSIEVTGQSISNTTEQRWKGIIELENIEGEWKIAEMRLQNKAVIYSQNNIVHLGDEEIKGWNPLHGECFTATFNLSSQIQKLTLKLDLKGSNARNPIFLNGTQVGLLPQTTGRGWNYGQRVILPIGELQQQQSNQLKLCSGLFEPGDKDDLQFKKLKLRVE